MKQSISQPLPWQYSNPFTMQWRVSASDLDDYNHANNVTYVSQLEKLAWQHSGHLGLGVAQYQEQDRGMAIVRHELDYLGSAYEGDEIHCGTWITYSDHKLKLQRQFQFIRGSDQQTLFKATTHFVCIALSSGKPKRMPSNFIEAYEGVMISNTD